MPPTQVSRPASRTACDRAQAALVANRRRDLVVVAQGRLDVVVDALDAGLLERQRPRVRHVADRSAALQVRVLGDQAHPLEVLLEVALR